MGGFGSVEWGIERIGTTRLTPFTCLTRFTREESMMTKECVIRNRLGLHARAAAKFVHTATRFASQIRVSRDGRTMDGKSIMGILLLAAAAGTTVVITADGADEADAVDALCRLVEGGFGEELWSA